MEALWLQKTSYLDAQGRLRDKPQEGLPTVLREISQSEKEKEETGVKTQNIGTIRSGYKANQRWSMDFVLDTTAIGNRIRILMVIDEYTRECLALETHS